MLRLGNLTPLPFMDVVAISPLSRIQALFPVTHQNHGMPLSYHQALIG